MKYVPMPQPNDFTREDGEVYAQTRAERGESAETVAKRCGVTSAELLKFEAGEGLIIDDDEELWQLPNGHVRYGPIGAGKKPI